MARLLPKLVPLGVFLAAFLLFAPSFGAWFAILDFNHLDAIRSTDATTFFLRIFDPSDGGRNVIGTGDLYRPTYYSVFWLEYQLFGAEATQYHVFNATLHAANAVLVYLLAWRLTRSQLASAAGALVWAFHPQYADAVAWISSTTDLLLVFFSLSAVLLYARALETEGQRRWLGVGASFGAALLALGAKETGIVVVVLIAGYHLLLGEPDLLRRRHLPWPLLPFLAIPLVYLPLRAALVGNLVTTGDNELFTWDVFAHIHTLASLAAGPVVWQSVSHSADGVGQGAAGIALIACTVVAVLIGSRREWFLVGWFYVALAPVLALSSVWLIGRYLYLPSVGIAILAGIAIARTVELIPARSAIVWVRQGAGVAVVFAVLVWFGVLNVDHQSWWTAKGEEAERFIASLQSAYPVLPETGRLIVTEHPRSLSLFLDDGMMLGPAVRFAYDRDVEVLTPKLLRRAETPPPSEQDVWYPP